MFKKKLFIALIIGGLLLAQLPVSASTSFSLYPLKISVKEGQTFRLAINVNPNNLKNYTVKASVNFPADLVSVSSWQFSSSWQPLSQSGYDLIDNKSGILIKTAGYPGGLSKATTLGTITFKAKKTGTGFISFTGASMALDEGNTNQYSGGNQVPLTIEKLVETPMVTKPTIPTIPTAPTKPNTEAPSTTTPVEIATSTELNPPLGEQPEVIIIETSTPEIISPEEVRKINNNLDSLNINLSNIVKILLIIALFMFILIVLVLIVLLIYIFRKRGSRTRVIISEDNGQVNQVSIKDYKTVDTKKNKVVKQKATVASSPKLKKVVKKK